LFRPEGDFFSSHTESWTRQNDGGLQLRNRNAREIFSADKGK
jgi:hypothetical protein